MSRAVKGAGTGPASRIAATSGPAGEQAMKILTGNSNLPLARAIAGPAASASSSNASAKLPSIRSMCFASFPQITHKLIFMEGSGASK